MSFHESLLSSFAHPFDLHVLPICRAARTKYVRRQTQTAKNHKINMPFLLPQASPRSLAPVLHVTINIVKCISSATLTMVVCIASHPNAHNIHTRTHIKYNPLAFTFLRFVDFSSFLCLHHVSFRVHSHCTIYMIRRRARVIEQAANIHT